MAFEITLKAGRVTSDTVEIRKVVSKKVGAVLPMGSTNESEVLLKLIKLRLRLSPPIHQILFRCVKSSFARIQRLEHVHHTVVLWFVQKLRSKLYL